MNSLSKFYNQKNNINKLLSIIEPSLSPIKNEERISLRLIDWFITNYAKKNNVIITNKVNNNIIHFNVYLSYRSQLKAYSKQLFDPFRRRERIIFNFDTNNSIETTIGQLNIFKWIIQNNILDFILLNLDTIEKDMIGVQKTNNTKKNNDENIKVKMVKTDGGDVLYKTRKKRMQLSQNSVKNMNLYVGNRIITFN